MLTAEEVKEQLDRIAKEVKEQGEVAKKEVVEALKDKAAGKDVDAIKSAFEAYCEKAEAEMVTLRKAAEDQGIALAAMKEGAGQAQHKSFEDNLREAFKANTEAMTTMKSDKFAKGLNLAVKAAGTMTTTNILPSVSTAVPYSLADFESGITRIQRRKPYLRELIGARPINTMYAAWAEQVNVDGAANVTAEGAAKAQIDFDVQERTQKVEKVTGYAKTSKENLADIDAMMGFIQEEIRELVELKFDQQLYSGTGTSPQLKGLTVWAATASVASTPFALGVDQANNWDVLAAVLAIMSNNNFNGNTILLNPMDHAIMMMVKTTYGEYIEHPLSTPMGQAAAGVVIAANSGVTAGDFVVFDSSKVSLRIREEFNIQVGFENDDFTKNLVTVLGEIRAVQYVKTNHANAVVKGAFATVKAAMETA